ncbi:MAG: thioredoxin family protein [Saprospiraceae bacterium]|nr:thioredoxin family protein [Saprospiraceae bacterium]
MESLTTAPTLNRDQYRHYFETGISYADYMRELALAAETPDSSPQAIHLPQNLQRSTRIGKTIRLTEDVQALLPRLQERVHWLVLAELWCGDGSQILPVLNAIAGQSEGKIELRILYRDQNPDLMAAHRSGNSASIPKLVQLDEQFELIGSWGPRPAAAQALVLELKQNPATAPTYSEELHKWYARDRQVSIQEEIAQLLLSAVPEVA